MNNVEFAKMLEARTLAFAVLMIRLSVKLPNTPEGRIIREQLIKAAISIEPTTEKRIILEARLTSETRSKYAKARPAKPNIGWT